MKKLLLSIGLVVGISASALAQNHGTASFLKPNISIYMTNAATFLTNTVSPLDSITTNLTGVTLTNVSTGSVITSNNVWAYQPFLDVSRYVPRNADYLTVPSTNAIIWMMVPPAYAGANSTNAISLEFAGIPGSVNSTNVEDTTTTALTLSTSSATLVQGTWTWPIPASKYPGFKALRLRKVYCTAPVAAASQFVISGIFMSSFNP